MKTSVVQHRSTRARRSGRLAVLALVVGSILPVAPGAAAATDPVVAPVGSLSIVENTPRVESALAQFAVGGLDTLRYEAAWRISDHSEGGFEAYEFRLEARAVSWDPSATGDPVAVELSHVVSGVGSTYSATPGEPFENEGALVLDVPVLPEADAIYVDLVAESWDGIRIDEAGNPVVLTTTRVSTTTLSPHALALVAAVRCDYASAKPPSWALANWGNLNVVEITVGARPTPAWGDVCLADRPIQPGRPGGPEVDRVSACPPPKVGVDLNEVVVCITLVSRSYDQPSPQNPFTCQTIPAPLIGTPVPTFSGLVTCATHTTPATRPGADYRVFVAWEELTCWPIYWLGGTCDSAIDEIELSGPLV